ncbi:MAG: ACT domain-containing protein, partial [Chloroflexota bacterium]
GEAANPDRVLTSFERLGINSPNQPDLYRTLLKNPRALEILVTLFAGSQFLTEILLRQPEYLEHITQFKQLAQAKSYEMLYDEAKNAVSNSQSPEEALGILRRFQQWELLRIGVSDLLGAFNLPTVTTQLSYLADTLVQVCLEITAAQQNIDTDNFIIIAMGKLGGEELNYSSDIDLLFLAKENGTTYARLGQRLIDALAKMTTEGFLYRVDMRLRPWGRDGALVSSLAGYRSYIQKHAKLWERQALLKARVIAGNIVSGEEFLQDLQPLLFTADPQTIRTELRTLKQRIETSLKQRNQEWGEVKLGQGSIRDIEFVTQYLQLTHGKKHPAIRNNNTLNALALLSNHNLLSTNEYRVLVDGYIFLRTIEHHLQLMHYQQTHALPDDVQALTYLAQRLGFRGGEQDNGGPTERAKEQPAGPDFSDNESHSPKRLAGENFVARYQQHSAVIRAVYQKYLGEEAETDSSATKSPDLLPHLSRLPAAYAATFSDPDIEQHAKLAELLTPDDPVQLQVNQRSDSQWQITIVSYDYLGTLSMICGLLFIYKFNITDGQVFSYGASETTPQPPKTATTRRYRRNRSHTVNLSRTIGKDTRRKIVDVFTVSSWQSDGAEEGEAAESPVISEALWKAYSDDLSEFIKQLQAGHQREAQGQLAKRIAITLSQVNKDTSTLYPVDIEIDNSQSGRHTVLQISAPDTIGFLYEFTNALALAGVNVRRMVVRSDENWVQNTLYVTDRHHNKIKQPEK